MVYNNICVCIYAYVRAHSDVKREKMRKQHFLNLTVPGTMIGTCVIHAPFNPEMKIIVDFYEYVIE